MFVISDEPGICTTEYHLFFYAKRHPAEQNFPDTKYGIKIEVKTWFRQQVVNFYDREIQKLVS